MAQAIFDEPSKALDLAARAALPNEARALVQPAMSVRQAVAALAAGDQHLAALRLAARALPRREAVWWACLCFRAGAGKEVPPAQLVAVELAEKWVVSPGEEHRRAAGGAAEAADVGTAAGQAAMAAFWSGGSLAPPKLAVVPPAEHLLHVAAANAAILAGLGRGPKDAGRTYEHFLALAAEVAEGKNRWPEDRPAASTARPVTRRP